MKKLTIEYVNKKIALIDKVKSDFERAHVEESNLKERFLYSLIECDYTIEEIKQLAALIDTTKHIKFQRLFA